ncbi:dioxygenase [Mycolicibacterium acapulense]|nr:dioxygenase [Mycolicibacterium acapulense]
MADSLPALFLSHGAPPLVDDELWVRQLAAWATELPRPAAILVVSAHWESAPLTIGSTTTETPLTYDFWGFPERYYQTTYDAPGAVDLAARVEAMLPSDEPVRHDPDRRLDHGAYVPLAVMYPAADIPVLQISMPTLDPGTLLNLGERLRPLRDEGVLIIGSGFTTHGLPFLDDPSTGAQPPDWSTEFDIWAAEMFTAGDVDALIDFRHRAPGMPYAHPTIEHWSPLFVALGASRDPGQQARQVIDGYWMGLAKRSIELI